MVPRSFEARSEIGEEVRFQPTFLNMLLRMLYSNDVRDDSYLRRRPAPAQPSVTVQAPLRHSGRDRRNPVPWMIETAWVDSQTKIER